ncbi:MAG: cupin domain-containing protein [Almyronema sp.]
MSLPLILLPKGGESVQIGTSTCTFKATGQDTHGHVGLFEFTMPPATAGASPHIHKQMTEMFYVVEGEVELVLDQATQLAPAGSFMRVPENTPHGFANPGDRPAKLLILFCPADHREDYFRGLAELTQNGRQPSQEELLDLMHRFDQYPA